MFRNNEIPKQQRMLEEEYIRILTMLTVTSVDSQEYAKLLSSAERIYEMMDKRSPSIISRDTLVNAGTNLLGILLIIKHENVNVITSKALGFVSRVR